MKSQCWLQEKAKCAEYMSFPLISVSPSHVKKLMIRMTARTAIKLSVTCDRGRE